MSSYKKKLEDLGAHYGVAKGDMSLEKWSAAIKDKAGAKLDSIEQIYERFKNNPKAAAAKAVEAKPDKPVERAESVENPTVPANGGAVEILAPARREGAGSNAGDLAGAVSIHVASPTAVQAQVIHNPPRDFLGIATMLAARSQTLALGLVMGILISKPVLKMLGY